MGDIIEKLREYAQHAETRSERDTFEATINEITILREDLASAKRAAAAYEAWKFPEDIQELTVENARLREELAAAQSRITDLTKISATLNVRTSKLNALREENARVRAALDKCGDAMDYTDDYFDGLVAVVQDAKDALRAARAAIREGEEKCR